MVSKYQLSMVLVKGNTGNVRLHAVSELSDRLANPGVPDSDHFSGYVELHSYGAVVCTYDGGVVCEFGGEGFRVLKYFENS